MFDSRFQTQAALVVRCIPEVAKHDCFALKGGTAINLFVRDLPRVSVDIDLTYLPLRRRDDSLQEISDTLRQLKTDIEGGVKCSRVTERCIQGYVTKLNIGTVDAKIKIEPNLVLRGCLGVPMMRELTSSAQRLFRASVRIRTLADADLYGGKLCAALDRQHPRDLFDVKVLLDDTGITPAIRRAFVVYLAAHNRPMHELLDPNVQDLSTTYESDFTGMTQNPPTIDELKAIQAKLPQLLVDSLDEDERSFLLSMKSGEPDWNVLGIGGLEKMPALQWKLMNIRKMNHGKRAELLKMLRYILEP